MKRLASLASAALIISAALVLGGCSKWFSSGADTNPLKNSEYNPEEIKPQYNKLYAQDIPNGNDSRWKYKETRHLPEDYGGDQAYFLTRTIDGTKSVSGVLCRIFKEDFLSTFGYNYSTHELFKISTDGYYIYGSEDPEDTLLVYSYKQRIPEKFLKLPAELPYGSAAGDSWIGSINEGINEVTGTGYESKTEYLIESYSDSMTLKAGIFTECIRIRKDTTYNPPQNDKNNTTEYIWIKKGVGIIKMTGIVELILGPVGFTRELEEYSLN